MADDSKSRPPRGGRRKDGKPYKEGNTREDGSYGVGRNRTPESTRFKSGDGRQRGRRPAGTRNLMTDWREELAQKIAITEGGKTLKVTKQRALVKAKVSRGLGKSDRANEEALRYADLSAQRDPGLQTDDLELIEAWLSGYLGKADSDDLDTPLEPEADATGDDETQGDNA